MACVVRGCKSHKSRKENNDLYVSFHCFPKDENLKLEWIKRVRPNWVPTKYSRICSLHFSADSFHALYENQKWRRLKENAIPSLCLQYQGIETFADRTIIGQNVSSSLEGAAGCSSQYLQGIETFADRTIIGQNVSSCLEGVAGCSSQYLQEPLFNTFQEINVPPKKRLKRSQDTNDKYNDYTDLLERNYTLMKELDECKQRIEVLEKELFRAKTINKRRYRKINTLTKRITRKKKKNRELNDILMEKLKEQNVEMEQMEILQNINENGIIKKFLQKKSGAVVTNKYDLDIKKFAVTLHYLSPKAYTFIRDQFDRVLPHPKTISAWYKGVDCNPGFTTEALNSIRLRVQQNPEKKIFCGLAIDEMAIRKLIEWDSHNLKYYGYVNLGCDLDTDSNSLATQAFTIMVVSLNDSWKIPVGYFLISSLTGQQKASLIQQCIHLLSDCGVVVVSLTYDGSASNIAMANILVNNNTKYGSEKVSFKYNDNEVCLWPDPCHNVKLIRNAFANKQILLDEENNVISWKHITLLHDLQEKEGLHLGNKLKNDHVNFFNQKMKVRLATQLLSESVADALKYCQEKGFEGFEKCEGTIKFIKIFNHCFDILNSRNMRAKGFKKALSSFNIESIKEFFSSAEKYIKNLRTIDGTYIINSNRKTGFKGFITCIKSLIKIYENIVAKKCLVYLCTYKMSQDHLELFFGAIRSKCGFNNNPSARVFQAAYKRLLMHAQLKDGSSGNCVPLEKITILNTNSTPIQNINNSSANIRILNENIDPMSSYDDDIERSEDDYTQSFAFIQLTDCSIDIVHYIAGFIVRKLEKSLKCVTCMGSLRDIHGSKNFTLTYVKDRGGLVIPSSCVTQLCIAVEQTLRILKLQVGEQNLGKLEHVMFITNKVCKSFMFSQIFGNLSEHSLEQDFKDNHRNLLMKAICHLYCKIRIHYITKQLSIPRNKIRSFLTKNILFQGQ